MNVTFNIIQLIVYAGLLITGVNIYINYRLKQNKQFYRVLQLFNIYLVIHLLFVWFFETVFPEKRYLDKMAPFSLLYGTFLYLANYLSRNETISFKHILPHLVVPFIFWVWFFILLLIGLNDTNNAFVQIRQTIAAVSLFGYIFWSIFFNTKRMLKSYRIIRPIIISGSIALLIVVMIGVSVSFYNKLSVARNMNGIILLRSIVYTCMLGCAIMIFRAQLALMGFRSGKG